jgi:hypothetical protein
MAAWVAVLCSRQLGQEGSSSCQLGSHISPAPAWQHTERKSELAKGHYSKDLSLPLAVL